MASKNSKTNNNHGPKLEPKNKLKQFIENHAVVTFFVTLFAASSAIYGVLSGWSSREIDLKKKALEISYNQEVRNLATERLRLIKILSEEENHFMDLRQVFVDPTTLPPSYKIFHDKHFAIPQDIIHGNWELIQSNEFKIMAEMMGGEEKLEAVFPKMRNTLSKCDLYCFQNNKVKTYTFSTGEPVTLRARCFFSAMPWDLIIETHTDVTNLASGKSAIKMIETYKFLIMRIIKDTNKLSSVNKYKRILFLKSYYVDGPDEYLAFCLWNLKEKNPNLALELLNLFGEITDTLRRDRVATLMDKRVTHPKIDRLEKEISDIKVGVSKEVLELRKKFDNNYYFRTAFHDRFNSYAVKLKDSHFHLKEVDFTDKRFLIRGYKNFNNVQMPSGERGDLRLYEMIVGFKTSYGVISVGYIVPYDGSSESIEEHNITASMLSGFRIIK